MNTWTTKVMDLDNTLVQAAIKSQKCIWFFHSFATKTLFTMSISQFEAPKKLTIMAIESTYNKGPFSTLYDHVKDDAIHLDQVNHI
eukprot:15346615-Ditylum_brightwellii.AAC.2